MGSHVEHTPVGTQTSGDNESFEWRRQQYERMGFNGPEAIALANSIQINYTGGKTKNEKKLEWKTPLSWQKVEKALNDGCDKTTALDIFVNVDAK